MTEYQYSCNMLSLDMMSKIEQLMNQKQFKEIANILLVDPLSCLYVTEGSAFPDYVAGFQLDCVREAFAERLLKIAGVFHKSIYCIKITVEQGKDNLWRKFWMIDVR